MTQARPRPDPLWAAVQVDQFAAQALAAARPELRGWPFVVICQSADSHRAAVQAVSPQARALGAAVGMPVFALRRKLGRAVAVELRDESAEGACTAAAEALLSAWTPLCRLRAGWSRLTALADLSGTPAARQLGWQGAGPALAQALRDRVGVDEVAVGVSASRLVAKLLAREATPAGIRACAPGDEAEVIARTGTAGLPGLGSLCRERAARYGLDRAEQILALDRKALRRRFGRQVGERLYGLVRGLESQARDARPSAIEGETVLACDANDERLLRDALRLAVDKACDGLRQAGQVAKAVRLRLVYTDNRRSQKTAQLPASTDDFAALSAAAQRLFAAAHVRRVALKAVAVAALRTSPCTGQRDLFEGIEAQKRRQLGAALTDIRRRMGFSAVVVAGALELAGPHVGGLEPALAPRRSL